MPSFHLYTLLLLISMNGGFLTGGGGRGGGWRGSPYSQGHTARAMPRAARATAVDTRGSLSTPGGRRVASIALDGRGRDATERNAGSKLFSSRVYFVTLYYGCNERGAQPYPYPYRPPPFALIVPAASLASAQHPPSTSRNASKFPGSVAKHQHQNRLLEAPGYFRESEPERLYTSPSARNFMV